MIRNGISEDVLTQISALNSEFLGLFRREVRDLGAFERVLGLRGHLVSRLAQLSPGHLDRLAACPYALFDLRLSDAAFWRAVTVHNCPPSYKTSAPVKAIAADVQAFTHTALLYAWSLAATQPLAGRLSMGMSPEVAEILAATSIMTFGEVATDAPSLLIATHAGNKALWPDLLRYVAGGSQQQFEAAVRLGSQLVAAC